nr:MAG TPA: hypothetical protein [Bacteriophage sp.]
MHHNAPPEPVVNLVKRVASIKFNFPRIQNDIPRHTS